MRVGIDICRLTDPRTGVGNYIVNLLAGLAAVDKDTTYLLYPYFGECFARPVKDLQRYVPAQPNFRLYGRLRPEIWVKLWWFGLKIPQERLLGRVDVTHSTNLAGFRLRKSKLIVTVHDLSFLHEPAWHKAENVAFSKSALAGAVQHADALIAPSGFTAEELLRFYPETAGRVRVVPEAVSAGFSARLKDGSLQAVRAKYGLARPYFLFVGTLEPRKNLARLARAFHRFLAAGFKEYELVIAGGVGWKAQEALSALNDPAGQGLVRHLGYVPDEDLPALYQAALAFIYPSFYEGFGLPVLEALSCGLPVITSQDSSMAEIAGEAAWYVNPGEEKELSAAMARLVEDEGLRERLAAAGPARAALFSLAEMGRRTLAVYHELAG
jgi:glycosyltransferase involved in cell wall biosynthesis